MDVKIDFAKSIHYTSRCIYNDYYTCKCFERCMVKLITIQRQWVATTGVSNKSEPQTKIWLSSFDGVLFLPLCKIMLSKWRNQCQVSSRHSLNSRPCAWPPLNYRTCWLYLRELILCYFDLPTTIIDLWRSMPHLNAVSAPPILIRDLVSSIFTMSFLFVKWIPLSSPDYYQNDHHHIL